MNIKKNSNALLPDAQLAAIEIPAAWSEQAPQGLIMAQWKLGKYLYEHGLIAKKQTHRALKAVCHFLFYGNPDSQLDPNGYDEKEERTQLMLEWLRKKHNGYSTQVDNDKWKALEKECRSLANWEPLGRALNDRYQLANDQRVSESIRKISEQARQLQDSGIGSQRQFAKLCGVSVPTLNKYRAYWSHLSRVRSFLGDSRTEQSELNDEQ